MLDIKLYMIRRIVQILFFGITSVFSLLKIELPNLSGVKLKKNKKYQFSLFMNDLNYLILQQYTCVNVVTICKIY